LAAAEFVSSAPTSWNLRISFPAAHDTLSLWEIQFGWNLAFDIREQLPSDVASMESS
jgi:hypothetical protein